MDDLHRSPELVHVERTLFRTIALGAHRERRIYLTKSVKGKAVSVDTYASDGRRIGGTVHLFPKDLPAFIAALTDAAAEISVEIPAASAPQPAAMPKAGHRITDPGDASPIGRADESGFMPRTAEIHPLTVVLPGTGVPS